MSLALPVPAPRAPLGDLRPRRPRLAGARDDPAPALHALPAAGRATAKSRSSPPRRRCSRSSCSSGSRARSSASTSTAKDAAEQLTVVRTSFWFTMAMATVGLVLGVRLRSADRALLGLGNDPWLVRAGAVGLWAQTNYQQLTNLFRVEERSIAFAIASIANVADHGRAMIVLSSRSPLGRDRRGRRQLHRHARRLRRARRATAPSSSASSSTASCSARCSSSACRSCRPRSRCGRSTSSTACSSTGTRARRGGRLLARRSRSRRVITFVMIAFRTAWPAFAYSIEDEREAKRTYAFVLTYLLSSRCWICARARRASRRGSSSSCAADRSSTAPRRRRAARVRGRRRTPGTPCSRSAAAARGGRSSTGSSPESRAAAEHRAQLLAHPAPTGMVGAAVSTARGVRRIVRRDDDLLAARLPGRRTSGVASLIAESARGRVDRARRAMRSFAVGGRPVACVYPLAPAAARLLPARRTSAAAPARTAPGAGDQDGRGARPARRLRSQRAAARGRRARAAAPARRPRSPPTPRAASVRHS